VAVLTDWAPKEPGRIGMLRQAGCQVTLERPERLGERLLGRLLRRPKSFKLRRWLLGNAPDLVVVSQGGFKEGIPVAEESGRARIPYCLLANLATDSAWPSDGQRAALCGAYRQAAAAFFVSQANLDSVTTIFGSDLARAEVVRNPFNVDYDAAPPWPAANDKLRLACVGRLDPRAKGQDILFSVLAADKWRRREVGVDLYGCGPMEEGLKALAAYLGLHGIGFKGSSHDIAELWSHYEALVLPSRVEGLPLVLVEALLCGRPAIVTDVGGNTEVVEDGLTGFVASAPTVKLLDEALERAWQNRRLLRSMGERAAKRIRELVPRNPAARFADKLEELIQA
jgi:glycosyltransferase involved in cell wall biosynthesis